MKRNIIHALLFLILAGCTKPNVSGEFFVEHPTIGSIPLANKEISFYPADEWKQKSDIQILITQRIIQSTADSIKSLKQESISLGKDHPKLISEQKRKIRPYQYAEAYAYLMNLGTKNAIRTSSSGSFSTTLPSHGDYVAAARHSDGSNGVYWFVRFNTREIQNLNLASHNIYLSPIGENAFPLDEIDELIERVKKILRK